MTDINKLTDKQKHFLIKHLLDNMGNTNTTKEFSKWWSKHIYPNRNKVEAKIENLSIYDATHLISLFIKGDYSSIINFYNSI